jgi:hypothetical protein
VSQKTRVSTGLYAVYSRVLVIEIAFLRGLGSIWTPEDGASGKICFRHMAMGTLPPVSDGIPKTFLPPDVSARATRELMGRLINGTERQSGIANRRSGWEPRRR